ncbi:MFS transporter [Aquirhabdus sp.]|uniref:MFS transporter n=1 Tax=Aquirhabdus sp. TaxID=2824160 RepID=UPI00396CE2C3
MDAEHASTERTQDLPGWLVGVLAMACGLTVANLYYAQPLLNIIAPSLGLPVSMSSLIVTLTQLGYCAGLIFLVPLGDLLENRRLVVSCLTALIFALALAATACGSIVFMVAVTLVGFSTVAVQMMVPIAAHMAPVAKRGQIVGTIMSGLLLGIMLARPVASLFTDAFGWRALFASSAVAMGITTVVMAYVLPKRQPDADHSYHELIKSLGVLLINTPVLRWRAAYQAALFAAFTLFWTAVPLQLAGPTFAMSQRGIALFALAGVTGAIAAPIAGMLADRGWSRFGTGASLVMVAIAFALAALGTHGSLIALVSACILLDMGVQANLVFGQRAIYALKAEHRSRLNGLYMAIFFVGGAFGSAIASLLFTHGGWNLVCAIGLAFPLLALGLFFVERSRRQTTNISMHPQ